MPIARFFSRAAIAVAAGILAAAALPRIVLILFGWALARAFAG